MEKGFHFFKTLTQETNPEEIEGDFSFEELSQQLENATDFEMAKKIYQKSISCAEKESISEIDRDELQVWALGKMTEFATTKEDKDIIQEFYKENNT